LGRAKALLIDNGIDFDSVLAQGRLAVDVINEVITAGTGDRPKVDVG
jgi:hypothetical protein